MARAQAEAKAACAERDCALAEATTAREAKDAALDQALARMEAVVSRAQVEVGTACSARDDALEEAAAAREARASAVESMAEMEAVVASTQAVEAERDRAVAELADMEVALLHALNRAEAAEMARAGAQELAAATKRLARAHRELPWHQVTRLAGATYTFSSNPSNHRLQVASSHAAELSKNELEKPWHDKDTTTSGVPPLFASRMIVR